MSYAAAAIKSYHSKEVYVKNIRILGKLFEKFNFG